MVTVGIHRLSATQGAWLWIMAAVALGLLAVFYHPNFSERLELCYSLCHGGKGWTTHLPIVLGFQEEAREKALTLCPYFSGCV